MLRHSIFVILFAPAIFFLLLSEAPAEIGPCRPLGGDVMFCGTGNGAARTFYKATSPSGRPGGLSTDRRLLCPKRTIQICKILSYGSAMERSWQNLTAPTGVSVKVEQRAESASAELYAFLDDDKVIGPFELVDLLKPALLAKMQNATDAGDYSLLFFSHPAMTIDNQGRIHVIVCAVAKQNMQDGLITKLRCASLAPIMHSPPRSTR